MSGVGSSDDGVGAHAAESDETRPLLGVGQTSFWKRFDQRVSKIPENKIGAFRMVYLATFFVLLAEIIPPASNNIFFQAYQWLRNTFIFGAGVVGGILEPIYYLTFAAITAGLDFLNLRRFLKNIKETEKALDESTASSREDQSSLENKIYHKQDGNKFIFIDNRDSKNQKSYSVEAGNLDDAKKLFRQKMFFNELQLRLFLHWMYLCGTLGCLTNFIGDLCVPGSKVAKGFVVATVSFFTAATASSLGIPASKLEKLLGSNGLFGLGVLLGNSILAFTSLVSLAVWLGAGAIPLAIPVFSVAISLCLGYYIGNKNRDPKLAKTVLGVSVLFCIGLGVTLGVAAALASMPLGVLPAIAIGIGVSAIASIISAGLTVLIAKNSDSINKWLNKVTEKVAKLPVVKQINELINKLLINPLKKWFKLDKVQEVKSGAEFASVGSGQPPAAAWQDGTGIAQTGFGANGINNALNAAAPHYQPVPEVPAAAVIPAEVVSVVTTGFNRVVSAALDDISGRRTGPPAVGEQ